MSLKDLLFGRPLASHEEGEQRVGPVAGIPMLGLDALSSAAYGPEAAMTLLIPLGAAGLGYIGPISTVIIILLLIVYLSYRQTIAAYPTGGGSYTVARQNLGLFAGLLAAAALLLDYVLVVASTCAVFANRAWHSWCPRICSSAACSLCLASG
jgi:amino acid transporter